MENLSAGFGWLVGRQSQGARAGRFFCVALSHCQFNSPQYIYQSFSQVLHTLLEASADVPHSLDKAHLSVGASPWRAGWTLQYLTSVPSDWLTCRCLSSWLSGCWFGSLLCSH